MSTSTPAYAAALRLIGEETVRALREVAETQNERLDALDAAVTAAARVFTMGAGRSGLALRMTAMRLMHLGKTVFVVGDTTTPAIADGDLLILASGSGSAASIVNAAKTARRVGATVATITTAPESPLAAESDIVIVVPAAGKLDRSGAASAQYAGGLFEQTVVVIGDALFHTLWQRSGATADELWPRHANLE